MKHKVDLLVYCTILLLGIIIGYNCKHEDITEKNYKIIKVEKAEQGKCIYNTEEFTFISDSIYSIDDSIRAQVK